MVDARCSLERAQQVRPDEITRSVEEKCRQSEGTFNKQVRQLCSERKHRKGGPKPKQAVWGLDREIRLPDRTRNFRETKSGLAPVKDWAIRHVETIRIRETSQLALVIKRSALTERPTGPVRLGRHLKRELPSGTEHQRSARITRVARQKNRQRDGPIKKVRLVHSTRTDPVRHNQDRTASRRLACLRHVYRCGHTIRL